jgi:Spy/CpxP family protein refolding chaperone
MLETTHTRLLNGDLTMKTNRTIATSFALVLIASAGLAGASPEKKQHRDPDVLRGPKVTDTTTSQKKHDSMTKQVEQVDRQNKQNHQRKGKDAKGKPGADRPIQFRDYVFALRGIKSRNANIAGLDLSDAQKDQIKMILEEQRQAMRTFHEQNKDRMKELRERVKNGDRADEAREKLRDFANNAGPTRDALAKLKQVLSPEQQSTLKSHIKSARKQRAENAQRPNQDRPARRPNSATRSRNLQSDAPQSDRRRTQADRPQTDRPQPNRKRSRRKVDSDRVNNTGPKSDRVNKRNKKSKPTQPKTDG